MSEYKHYCYKILFETGHVYFGVRSCLCEPEEDTYLGSPSTHKKYWQEYEPKKVILKVFKTRKEASEAEKFLINWQWNSTDDGMLLSLNANIGGMLHNQLGVKRPEEVNEKTSKEFTVISPEGTFISSVNIRKFCRENNLERKTLGEMLNGKVLHCRGWTSSIEAHNLYKEKFEMAGISRDHTSWRVRIKDRATNFKTLEEAKVFRDKLRKEGHTFKPCCQDWNHKLKEMQDSALYNT